MQTPLRCVITQCAFACSGAVDETLTTVVPCCWQHERRRIETRFVKYDGRMSKRRAGRQGRWEEDQGRDKRSNGARVRTYQHNGSAAVMLPWNRFWDLSLRAAWEGKADGRTVSFVENMNCR